MSLPALYELAAEYRQALQTLSELDLPEEVVRDTLEGLQGDLQVKATNVAAFVRNLEATAQAIKQAEEQMAARRKAIEARAERIRQYLLENLKACGIQRIESPWFVIALRDNPPSVEVFDEAQLPAEFLVCPPRPIPGPTSARFWRRSRPGTRCRGRGSSGGRGWRSNKKPVPRGGAGFRRLSHQDQTFFKMAH